MSLSILKSLIAHRPHILAKQTPDKAVFPISVTSGETQEAVLRAHMAGQTRIGAYTTIPGASMVRWGCYDLDGLGHAATNSLCDPHKAADTLEASLLALGVPVLRERSGGGSGWHLWVVFDSLRAARDVRHWLRNALRCLAGFDVNDGSKFDPAYPRGVEVFPKQDALAEDESGNLVWLPFWGNAPDGNLYHRGEVIETLPLYHLDYTAPEEAPPKPTAGQRGKTRAKDVAEWLAYVEPNDYDTYLKVGMSLHHWEQTEGGPGLAFWIEWAKQNTEKFQEGLCESKWESFRRSTSAGSRSISSLRFEARKAGWCEIKRGSHVEIADHILDGGEVFDGSDLWRFDDTRGVWDRLMLIDLERKVMELDGLEIPGEKKPKVLNVSADLASSVARVATRRANVIDPAVWHTTEGFACANGWVSPHGIEPLHYGHYAREQLAVAYDPQASCPRWLKFIEESCDQESGLILQEFAGVSLFGQATKYGKALVLWGDGENGKSVFAETFQLMFDSAYVSSYAPHQFHDNGTKADLRLKKLNVVMELPERELIDTSSLKAIITGDQIGCRRPYDTEPINFKPKAAHLFCCNLLPETRNTDHGFWRRWLTVGFTRRPAKPDPDLKQKLAGELPGIVAWAVRGYARLRERQGYSASTSAEEIKAAWGDSMNPVKSFVLQACDTSEPDASVKGNDLYASYCRWCDLSRRTPLGPPKFGAEIKRHLKNSRAKTGMVYECRVKPESQWDLIS